MTIEGLPYRILIIKHFDEIQALLSLFNINFSVIGITETKRLKDIQPSINFSLQNYSTEHTPTELSSGGALLYIFNFLTSKPKSKCMCFNDFLIIA